jgi:hypothetical protein
MLRGATRTVIRSDRNGDAFFAVAVTLDGRDVVYGFGDDTLRVWDLATGETKTTIQGPH